jgi:hypothetical protein
LSIAANDVDQKLTSFIGIKFRLGLGLGLVMLTLNVSGLARYPKPKPGLFISKQAHWYNQRFWKLSIF